MEQQPPGTQGQPQWSSPPPPQSGWGSNPAPVHTGPTLSDFIMFRWMMTPGLIVVIWILGAIGITIFSLAALTNSYSSYYGGSGYTIGVILGFVFLQIWLRVLLEFIAVLFRVNNTLTSIDRKTPDNHGR